MQLQSRSVHRTLYIKQNKNRTQNLGEKRNNNNNNIYEDIYSKKFWCILQVVYIVMYMHLVEKTGQNETGNFMADVNKKKIIKIYILISLLNYCETQNTMNDLIWFWHVNCVLTNHWLTVKFRSWNQTSKPQLITIFICCLVFSHLLLAFFPCYTITSHKYFSLLFMVLWVSQ